MYHFMMEQDYESQKLYLNLLTITGALSNLYSDTVNPFIYYRAMENVFCKAFSAENLSRSDVSADASKDGVGIGLKTFLHQNGRTFQKIAEFNKESHLLRKHLENKKEKQGEEQVILTVSEMRNERIDFTKRSHELRDMIYHHITRAPYKMTIYEEPMDFVDISSIEILPRSKNTLRFKDKYNEYSYSLSKNTLFKRFITEDNYVKSINVNILDDPFEFLLHAQEDFLGAKEVGKPEEAFIILPLYSDRSGNVELKSGLNQWNASGRKRNENEVYIPIPSWIHKEFPSFFDYKKEESRGDLLTTDPFQVILPNNKKLSMKVAQAGGKALMSDPNADLGQWILRDVLNIKPNTIVTKEMLERKGIDSVRLSKINNLEYHLDFTGVGKYEEFKESTLDNVGNESNIYF